MSEAGWKTTREAVLHMDTEVLVGLVLQLTGGQANPSVVRAQIENWRKRYAEEPTPSPKAEERQ